MAQCSYKTFSSWEIIKLDPFVFKKIANLLLTPTVVWCFQKLLILFGLNVSHLTSELSKLHMRKGFISHVYLPVYLRFNFYESLQVVRQARICSRLRKKWDWLIQGAWPSPQWHLSFGIRLLCSTPLNAFCQQVAINLGWLIFYQRLYLKGCYRFLFLPLGKQMLFGISFSIQNSF